MNQEILRYQIEKIEETFFKEKVYVYCPKKVRLYEIKDIINSVFDEIDGKVYDLYYDIDLGALIYGLLYQDNKKKYVDRKFVYKGEIEKKQCSIWGKVGYYLYGNREKNSKVDHLLITSDYKLRNHFIQMLFDFSDERPRRLLFAPFFCLLNKCDRLDVLKLLANKGITDLRKEIEGGEISYFDIHEDLVAYEQNFEASYEERIILLKRLFGDYFSIRDFKNAKLWLDKLLPLLEKKDAEEFSDAWSRVESALDNAERDINQKNHILVNWIDALRYDNLHYLPCTESLMKTGIFFEKMYGHIFDTSATALSMFTGKGYIESRGFEQRAKDYSESRLFDILSRNGYGILESGQMLKYWHEDLDRECLGILYGGSGQLPCSLINFRGVCMMQECDKSIVFIHSSLSEIHVPCWCPRFVERRELIMQPENLDQKQKYERQMRSSEEYVDEQMMYYQRFWDKAKYQIIMSDHGQPEWEKHFTIEGINHTVFSILGSGVKAERIRTVNSILSFPDIIQALIMERPDAINDGFGDSYALVENDDPYSKRVFSTLSSNMNKERVEQWFQYRGIVSDQDSFIVFADGKEYYFRSGNETNNLINSTVYQERINELRKLCGRLFIDIYKENKYKISREIYEERGIKRSSKNSYV